MIIGIGTDILNSNRISTIITQFGDRFLNKIFTKKEREYCKKHKDQHLRFAKKFAAKEAVLKALGCGYSNGISFLNIEILNKETGQPFCTLTGIALQHLNTVKEISNSHLTPNNNTNNNKTAIQPTNSQSNTASTNTLPISTQPNSFHINISISDDEPMVVAFCVISM